MNSQALFIAYNFIWGFLFLFRFLVVFCFNAGGVVVFQEVVGGESAFHKIEYTEFFQVLLNVTKPFSVQIYQMSLFHPRATIRASGAVVPGHIWMYIQNHCCSF